MNRRELLFSLTGPFLGSGMGAVARATQRAPGKAFRLQLPHPLPDPFCLRWQEAYYVLGTFSGGRPARTGMVFDLYRSKDLWQWEPLGPILRLPEYEGSHEANYWAPEILPKDGRFFLYYTADSFGDPYRRYVRVAEAACLEGPYNDSGRPLTEKPSIDGHPVYLSSEEGYLFYTGNEGNPNMGQVLVDRLVSPVDLAQEPKKVFPGETVRWEEGAFLWRRENEFYLFTSQGNWRDGSYHVLTAKSSSVGGPYLRIVHQGENYRVLTSCGEQMGPGHNSLFRGPAGVTHICYHAWDLDHTGRYCWIAPLEWDGNLPRVRQ